MSDDNPNTVDTYTVTFELEVEATDHKHATAKARGKLEQGIALCRVRKAGANDPDL